MTPGEHPALLNFLLYQGHLHPGYDFLLSSKYIQFLVVELAPASDWLDQRVADMVVRW
jgi:hypothetical protein